MNLVATRSVLVSLCATVILTPGSGARAQDYTMTTLDWAPYTNEKLPAMGASAAVVTQALLASGNHLKIEFYPWNRTVNLAKSNNRYIAYFPEYYSKANAADFLYSDPIGVGPLVFIERKSTPVSWISYDSLRGKKIGVVRGYVNTEQLDAKIASLALTGDEAPDDVKNTLKLAAGRLDVAVVDANVFNYLAKNDASVKAVSGQLQVNVKKLEDKKLYVCFKKTPAGEKALKAFNQGLKKVDSDVIMKKYMN